MRLVESAAQTGNRLPLQIHPVLKRLAASWLRPDGVVLQSFNTGDAAMILPHSVRLSVINGS
jgi:hypothetical protein